MSATIEIVRFEVSPERRDTLISGHLDARRAIRAVSPPGDLWSRLAQLDARQWVEIVAWDRRALFERSLEHAPNDEVARAWFELAESGWSILTGVSATDSADPPPAEGELELVWTRVAESLPGGSPPEPVWSIDVQLDSQAWVDPSGWIEREPAAIRVNARRRPSRTRVGSPVPPASEREAAMIASAIDSADTDGAGT